MWWSQAIEAETLNSYEHVFEGLMQRIKRYSQTADFEVLRRAFAMASTAHADQFRKSGDALSGKGLQLLETAQCSASWLG